MNFGFFNMNMEYVKQLLTSEYFYLGVAVGAVLLFATILLLKIVYYFRSKCHTLMIAEDGGAFQITVVALESFINASMVKFQQVHTSSVKVFKCRGQYKLLIYLKVLPGANVIELRYGVREYIVAEMQKKLGMDGFFKNIDFVIINMPGSNDLTA